MPPPDPSAHAIPDSIIFEREEVKTCGVCGSDERAPFYPAGDVVQCQACGVLYVSPRPTQAAISAFYSNAGHYSHWDKEPGRDAMWRRRVAKLLRIVPGGRLLDVGAGQGDFGAIARDHYQVEGTEISSDGVGLARQRHGLVLHHGDISDLPLLPGSYDIVTMWHVLEHVPSPRVTLDRCFELLKPGGVVAIAVPNSDYEHRITKQNLRAAARLLYDGVPARWVPFDRLDLKRSEEEVHLTHFTMRTLTQALRRSGFRIKVTGVDDCSVQDDRRNKWNYFRSSVLHKLTRLPESFAIFAAAQKPR